MRTAILDGKLTVKKLVVDEYDNGILRGRFELAPSSIKTKMEIEFLSSLEVNEILEGIESALLLKEKEK